MFSSRFENARMLLINPEETVRDKSTKVFLRSTSTGKDQGVIVPAPFDFNVEKSETICMQSIKTQGK
jgi:hypothetical protein